MPARSQQPGRHQPGADDAEHRADDQPSPYGRLRQRHPVAQRLDRRDPTRPASGEVGGDEGDEHPHRVGQQQRPRPEHQVGAGEYVTPGVPRKLFNGVCGGCHGSVTGEELDVAVTPDVLTGASISRSRDLSPKSLQ